MIVFGLAAFNILYKPVSRVIKHLNQQKRENNNKMLLFKGLHLIQVLLER